MLVLLGFQSQQQFIIKVAGMSYSVQQTRSSIIANGIGDSVVIPCLKSIAVAKTSDRGGNKTVRTELAGSSNANLSKPHLVPDNFSGHIKVCRIVLVLVGECV